jgi:FAD/FMN-containing dehydrogenase
MPAALMASVWPSLESCDFFLDDGLQLVLEHQRRQSPLRTRAPFYVLAECAAATDPTEELAAALQSAGVDDALVADDTASREGLWKLREGHADAINAAGIPHKLDVGIPLDELDRFLTAVPEVAAAAGGERTILFGHLGDGNVHVNVLGPAPDDVRVDDAVLELALDCGGTISAEHGVGVEKAHWLERARGATEVAAIRAVKDALTLPACSIPERSSRASSDQRGDWCPRRDAPSSAFPYSPTSHPPPDRPRTGYVWS